MIHDRQLGAATIKLCRVAFIPSHDLCSVSAWSAKLKAAPL